MRYIENRTFDAISVGDTASLERTLREEDIELFAILSGDVNPSHVDHDFAENGHHHEIIAHGMWGGALISGVLGTELPGPGTLYLAQSLSFKKTVAVGDTITARVTVTAKDDAQGHVTLACACINQDGETVIDGEARVVAPRVQIRRPRMQMPEVTLSDFGARFDALIAATRDVDPLRTAVVHPCDPMSLGGAIEAAEAGLIEPILVGPEAKIRTAAEEAECSLSGVTIIDAPHSHAAADAAVALVREGKAEGLMKGALHTDEFLGAIMPSTAGLRTERRMSHVFALDAPHADHLLFITDAAINISPGLVEKRDIIQNAIDLARALDVDPPRVAILSAVETVTPKIPSTVEAAALCKMADRGQITGGLLDGPLAFDNAVSAQAARTKKIASQVAGHADILIAPDMETGNMLAKQLIHLAGAAAAGVVLGARIPIMLTSRADGVLARKASCALALMFARRQAALG